jgi:hypothetical protein
MTCAPAQDRYARMVYNRCGRSGLKLPAVSPGLWIFGRALRRHQHLGSLERGLAGVQVSSSPAAGLRRAPAGKWTPAGAEFKTAGPAPHGLEILRSLYAWSHGFLRSACFADGRELLEVSINRKEAHAHRRTRCRK